MSNMQIIKILSHGKITDLTNGFQKKVPFSVYIKPKNSSTNVNVIVNCKCICDDEVSELPITLNDWTSAAITSIAPNAIDLSEYDVFWGAGNTKI